MKQIGILLTDIGRRQISFYAIHALNKLAQEGYDVVVFHENPAPPVVQPNFAVLSLLDCYSYSGPVIATNLGSAQRLLVCPGPSHKYFLVADLEWRRGIHQWEHLVDIYRNTELTLLARSRDHADLIASAWNIKYDIKVIGDFSPVELKELCQEI